MLCLEVLGEGRDERKGGKKDRTMERGKDKIEITRCREIGLLYQKTVEKIEYE